MKTENTMFFKSKKFLIGAIVAFVATAGILTFSGSGSGMLLSQFSGTNVTPSNASALWKSSTGNTYRPTLSVAYAQRIDVVIVNILARGSALSKENYIGYLTSVNDGIAKLVSKPQYAGDKDILNIIGYVTYELIDIQDSLSSGNLLMGDFTDVVNNSLQKYQSGTGTTNTAGTNTGTVTNSTGTTGAGNTNVTTGTNTGTQTNTAGTSDTTPVGTTATPVTLVTTTATGDTGTTTPSTPVEDTTPNAKITTTISTVGNQPEEYDVTYTITGYKFCRMEYSFSSGWGRQDINSPSLTTRTRTWKDKTSGYAVYKLFCNQTGTYTDADLKDKAEIFKHCVGVWNNGIQVGYVEHGKTIRYEGNFGRITFVCNNGAISGATEKPKPGDPCQVQTSDWLDGHRQARNFAIQPGREGVTAAVTKKPTMAEATEICRANKIDNGAGQAFGEQNPYSVIKWAISEESYSYGTEWSWACYKPYFSAGTMTDSDTCKANY